MSAGDEVPSWEPRELGFSRALLVAVLLVAAITAVGVWISVSFSPTPAPQAIQVTQVTLAQLPKPAPLAPLVPPKVVPPPKPLPAVIPKPPPVPSPIAVPTMPPPPPPPPPVRHVYKPAPHPVIRHVAPAQAPARPAPPPAAAVPQPATPAAPPAAPVVRTSGIPIYGEQIYSIIQANQNVPAVLSEMGASGTAEIEIVVGPNGRVLSARVVKSSGVPIIDATALEHARDAQLPPFNSDMPAQPHAFLVPIEIRPGQND
ncbi:energy transducer TonB [Acidocella sp.]|jgi:protein TonB|uniref:energy transducer TonB n=1 Tax=Acidocella sp. TaxID=50710 RepID=UPI002F4066CA